jgi:hypothetical protein
MVMLRVFFRKILLCLAVAMTLCACVKKPVSEYGADDWLHYYLYKATLSEFFTDAKTCEKETGSVRCDALKWASVITKDGRVSFYGNGMKFEGETAMKPSQVCDILACPPYVLQYARDISAFNREATSLSMNEKSLAEIDVVCAEKMRKAQGSIIDVTCTKAAMAHGIIFNRKKDRNISLWTGLMNKNPGFVYKYLDSCEKSGYLVVSKNFDFPVEKNWITHPNTSLVIMINPMPALKNDKTGKCHAVLDLINNNTSSFMPFFYRRFVFAISNDDAFYERAARKCLSLGYVYKTSSLSNEFSMATPNNVSIERFEKTSATRNFSPCFAVSEVSSWKSMMDYFDYYTLD